METTTTSLKPLADTMDEMGNQLELSKLLLEGQIQAVIDQDLEQLNELLQKQVELQERIGHSEQQLSKLLRSLLNIEKGGESSVRMSDLWKLYGDRVGNLREKSSALELMMKKVRSLHDQFMDLLEFAQKQNADMLQVMYDLSREHALHYEKNGSSSRGDGTGLNVNRKA